MSNIQNSNWMNTADFCLQRRRRNLMNKPPPRLDSLSSNPYLFFTQQQLDMRRKAEVLKYSAVSTNSKTNNLTKAEKYAQMARFSKSNSSYVRMAKIQETCPVDELIKTPNYYCDVPGPYTLLYMDEKVQLYNYGGKGNETKAVENPPITNEPYSIVSYENVSPNTFIPGIVDDYVFYGENLVSSIYLSNQNIQQGVDVQTNIGFNFSNVSGGTSRESISVTVANIYVYIYYNKTLISTNDNTINLKNTFTPPVVSLDDLNILQFTINPSGSIFNGQINLGTVKILNCLVCSQPSAVYDVRITVKYTILPENVIQYSTLANFNGDNISNNYNIFSDITVPSFTL